MGAAAIPNCEPAGGSVKVEVEAGFGAEDATIETESDPLRIKATKNRRANRGHPPKHLWSEEIVIEPPIQSCPCYQYEIESIVSRNGSLFDPSKRRQKGGPLQDVPRHCPGSSRGATR